LSGATHDASAERPMTSPTDEKGFIAEWV
jgi:hypothetical protein